MADARRYRQPSKTTDQKSEPNRGFRPIGPAAIAAAAAQIRNRPKAERPKDVPPILRKRDED